MTDFYFKKLGKMLNDPDYNINERFAPKLLDLGFIKEIKYNMHTMGFLLSCSTYLVTKIGKRAYNDWKNGKT